MSRRLRLHPWAQRELAEAAAYYEAASSGLGDAFFAEVRTFDRILVFPEACPVSRGGVRIKVLEAFPYSAHYAIPADDDVLVVSIAHHKRRPFYRDDRV